MDNYQIKYIIPESDVQSLYDHPVDHLTPHVQQKFKISFVNKHNKKIDDLVVSEMSLCYKGIFSGELLDIRIVGSDVNNLYIEATANKRYLLEAIADNNEVFIEVVNKDIINMEGRYDS